MAQYDGQPVFGWNYDWDLGDGLVVVNPRGLSKPAVTLNPTDAPLSWTAKHASITFNQDGVDLPTGGMNEVGLVAEQMWLDSTVYLPPDARPTFNELQWIPYAPDGFAGIEELANATTQLRYSPVYATAHYLSLGFE